MQSRIDTVRITNNGRHATVSGPIDGWDDDELGATFATAFTQIGANGQLVMAAGESPVFVSRNDNRWTIEVSVIGPGHLTDPGNPVEAWASASVHLTDGTFEPYPWEVNDIPVTNSPAAAAH